MKPGKETSEFILTLMPWILAIVVLIVLAVGGLDTPTALVILAGLGIGGGYASGKYAESRGMVKMTASHKEEAAE